MKYLIAFLLSALGASMAEVHDNPLEQRIYPWGEFGCKYRAVTQVKNPQGQIVSETPDADVWVSMVIIDDEESGFHGGHGSDRPGQVPYAVRVLTTGETPTHMKTGADGWVEFAWHGNNFSGKVTTLLVPDDIRYGSEMYHTYLGYVDFKYGGSTLIPQYLKPLQASGFELPFVRHDDTRHRDAQGLTGNSRYGTVDSLAAVEIIAYYYQKWNPNGGKLDIIRGSLTDGGCADNKMLAGGTTAYQYGVWQQLGCNPYGVEWDLENPIIANGGAGSPVANLFYGIFERVAYNVAHCLPAAFQDNGTTPMTSPITGVAGSMYQQPVVRIVCTSSPGVKTQ